MLKTLDLNDDAHKYIAQLVAENERLQCKVKSLENACSMLNYENEQAKKDKPLADAIRTIIKEWKNYDCESSCKDYGSAAKQKDYNSLYASL